MKRCILVLFLFSFSFVRGYTQLNIALGATSHHGRLDYQTNGQFNNSPYFNPFIHTIGTNILISIDDGQRFNYRLSIGHHQKNVQVGQEYLLWNGLIKKGDHSWIIPSFELGMSVNYQITSTTLFFSRLGFVVSVNGMTGHGGSLGSIQTILSEPNSNDWFYNAAIQLGGSYQPKLRLLNRQLELSADVFLSPHLFLPEPVVTDDLVIQGRYHYASVGLYLWLFKQTKNEK